MKRLLLNMLLLIPLTTLAADPGFDAGASFGKENASAGTGSLKNPDTVTSAIPGYTANPPEKGYYGGVNGSDSPVKGRRPWRGTTPRSQSSAQARPTRRPRLIRMRPLSPQVKTRRVLLTGS